MLVLLWSGRGGYGGGGRGGQRRNQGWVDYEYNYEGDRRPPGGDRQVNKVRTLVTMYGDGRCFYRRERKPLIWTIHMICQNSNHNICEVEKASTINLANTIKENSYVDVF